MSVALKVPSKVLADKFLLQDFKDDLTAINDTLPDGFGKGTGANSIVGGESNNSASGIASYAEGRNNCATTTCAHTEGTSNLALHGTVYTITAFDNTLKTITLDVVTGLSTSVVVSVKVNNAKSVENIPITAINGLVVTLNTTETITANWIYALKKATTLIAVHAEGTNNLVAGSSGHVEGSNNVVRGSNSHAEGTFTIAKGNYSHSEGISTKADGSASHAEGNGNIASGNNSHAEGSGTTAKGSESHAEGNSTRASDSNCHAEGSGSLALTYAAHAEGMNSIAGIGKLYSVASVDDVTKVITLTEEHTLVVGNTVFLDYVNYIGDNVAVPITAVTSNTITVDTSTLIANSINVFWKDTSIVRPTHVEGIGCHATGYNSHAEGWWTKAKGNNSHSQNYGTIAQGQSQTALGEFNTLQGTPTSRTSTDKAFIIGNGTSDSVRSNAMDLTWDGTMTLAGDIVSGNTVFETAGGTATAITLAIKATLVNGYAKTFIASANNSGAATTINTKPLYKPGTTTAPTLVAGKAYTAWYNLASNCFFIKASTEGTATAAQVLAGVSFSNDEDVNIPGEMENFNNTDVYAMQISNITEGEFGIPCPITGYIGTDTIIYVNDAYFSKNNIKNGVTMFGMIGEYDKEVTNPITAAKVLAPSVGFVNGAKVTGSMINKTGTTEYPSGIAINGMTANTYDTQFRVSIPTGYHENSFIAPRIPNCIPSNIKTGVKVGCDSAESPYVITGTYDAEATNPITAATVANGKIGFVNGAKITGIGKQSANGVKACVSGVLTVDTLTFTPKYIGVTTVSGSNRSIAIYDVDNTSWQGASASNGVYSAATTFTINANGFVVTIPGASNYNAYWFAMS